MEMLKGLLVLLGYYQVTEQKVEIIYGTILVGFVNSSLSILEGYLRYRLIAKQVYLIPEGLDSTFVIKAAQVNDPRVSLIALHTLHSIL